MTKSNGHPALALLDSLALAWASGRGSKLVQLPATDGSHGTIAEGPGFLYHWTDSLEPILITFVPEGMCRKDLEKSRNLFIGVMRDGLSFRTGQLPSQSFKFIDPIHRQCAELILDEARIAVELPDSSDPRRTLSTIIAAQRLLALGHDVQASNAAERHDAKPASKHHFATELHEWLSGQIEKSVKLGDAAIQFKKSPRQLIRMLKETTGSGFVEHLTMHRLTFARALLMRTDISIMDIARKSGFNSREQFIRSFSKAFAWTPLQFRKAWNKASLSNGDLRDLCQISERTPVSWHAPGHTHTNPTDSTCGSPQTLIVSNALHDIVELFSIDADGKHTRSGLLDRGAMNFINRDMEGSRWMVRVPQSKFERTFTTPNQHAVAVVSSDL